jgi:hypothetical protein
MREEAVGSLVALALAEAWPLVVTATAAEAASSAEAAAAHRPRRLGRDGV